MTQNQKEQMETHYSQHLLLKKNFIMTLDFFMAMKLADELIDNRLIYLHQPQQLVAILSSDYQAQWSV